MEPSVRWQLLWAHIILSAWILRAVSKSFWGLQFLLLLGTCSKYFSFQIKTWRNKDHTLSSVISEYSNTNWKTSSAAHLQVWIYGFAPSRDNSIFVWPLSEEFALQHRAPGEHNAGTIRTLTAELKCRITLLLKELRRESPVRSHQDDEGTPTRKGERAWTAQPGEERDLGNLINVNKYQKGEHRKSGARHFPGMPSEGMWGNRHKLKHRTRF